MTLTAADKDARKYRKALLSLTETVQAYLRLIDRAMKNPSSEERGKQIAALSNRLELENDKVRRFELGINQKKKRRAAKLEEQRAERSL